MTNSAPRHGMHRLARAVGAVTRAAFGRQGFAEARVLTDWPAIVGPDLAADCLPESLSANGVLRIRVAGGRALELQHLEPQLLDRIATFFGYRAVTRLSFVQGPLPPRTEPAPPSQRPLEPDEEAALAANLETMPDPGLRTALERLGRAVLARERPPASGRQSHDEDKDAP
jgi:hypothetical protein